MSYTSEQIDASDYVLKDPVKAKSAYDLQMEKIAKTEAFKNRSDDDILKNFTSTILGTGNKNTDNYYVDNKTGTVNTTPQNSNLMTYLQENNLDYLTPESIKPLKLEDERIASQNKTVFLRHEAEIKAQGGSVPELNLLDKQQVNKYNEISNIITQSKPDDSQQAIQDVNSSVNEFLSLDNPITQTAKTNGTAQVEATGIKDSTVISLGFTPEDVGDFQVPKSKQTDKKKDFVSDNKTSTGLLVAGIGAGLLGLVYVLSKRKGN